MDIKPTIYLIKDTVASIDQIFKDTTSLRKKISGEVWLYYKDSLKNAPKWLSFISSAFPVDETKIFNASSYAVIILKAKGRFFAIPFGMGSHLINFSMIDYNFGLKIALNCIPQNELRQIDLTTPETNSQKTKKQAVKGSTTEDFSINKQKDILRGVAGKLPEGHPLGKRIEGKDSIRTHLKVSDLAELTKLCEKLLNYSLDASYKNDYPWIDNMAIISDPILVNDLYEELIAAIKKGILENMYISTPQFVEDLYQYEGFIFSGTRKRKNNKTVYPFPSVKDLIQDMGVDFINSLSQNSLSKVCRVWLKDNDGETKFGWPLNRCLVWETNKDDSKYILSEGTWYRVDTEFYNSVNKFFKAHVKPNSRLPTMPSQRIIESEYNYMACNSDTDLHLFDLGHAASRHRSIGKDRNEICDIFDSSAKSFFHVKLGKASVDISHLLRQGIFSGRALKADTEQFNLFKGYLAECGCIPEVIPSTYNPSDYKIVFAIILDQSQTEDIPFFSKVSFKDAAELTLEMMGYNCEFQYIHTESDKSKNT
ncbi:TPA: DUF6119 family protein [Legionella feeleii]